MISFVYPTSFWISSTLEPLLHMALIVSSFFLSYPENSFPDRSFMKINFITPFKVSAVRFFLQPNSCRGKPARHIHLHIHRTSPHPQLNTDYCTHFRIGRISKLSVYNPCMALRHNLRRHFLFLLPFVIASSHLNFNLLNAFKRHSRSSIFSPQTSYAILVLTECG